MIRTLDPDSPAFPVENAAGPGLTLRQYFAAQALTGLLAYVGTGSVKNAAEMAVVAADALLVELAKPKP